MRVRTFPDPSLFFHSRQGYVSFLTNSCTCFWPTCLEGRGMIHLVSNRRRSFSLVFFFFSCFERFVSFFRVGIGLGVDAWSLLFPGRSPFFRPPSAFPFFPFPHGALTQTSLFLTSFDTCKHIIPLIPHTPTPPLAVVRRPIYCFASSPPPSDTWPIASSDGNLSGAWAPRIFGSSRTCLLWLLAPV